MSGWIKIHRKLVAHWLRKDPVKFTWWVIMLLEVNHSANKISLGNSIFRIERGQSAKSLRSWAAIFETGTKAVTNFFDLLESDGMITRQTLGKGKHSTTLINITNYNEYQGCSETQGLTQDYTQWQREGHTNNNDNNTKNENNGKEEDAAISEIISFYQKHRKENWVDLNNISERENSEIKKLLTKFSLQDIKQTIIAATESEYYQDFDLVKFANIFREENASKLLRGEFRYRKSNTSKSAPTNQQQIETQIRKI